MHWLDVISRGNGCDTSDFYSMGGTHGATVRWRWLDSILMSGDFTGPAIDPARYHRLYSRQAVACTLSTCSPRSPIANSVLYDMGLGDRISSETVAKSR